MISTSSVAAARDRGLLYGAAFARAGATSMVAVLLGIHLAELRFSPSQIGFAVAAGLAGTAFATLLITLGADRLGRRRILLVLALLGWAGLTAVALASTPWLVASAAFLGMVNGMGRDRGAAAVLEQAALPATTEDANRTRSFAWYNVVQDVGHALGAMAAALPAALQRVGSVAPVPAGRITLAFAGILTLSTAFLYLGLSPRVEVRRGGRRTPLAADTRRVLWRISSLFALDSLAGGFLTSALLAFFFYERFGVGPAEIGLLFFGARTANALSHLGAARLAERFGLVRTMVFTHIPSSLLLMTVPIAPSFGVAAVLFLLRESLVEMDVPTRQSYVMAVVRPEERTVAAGVTQLVRVTGWAAAPAFAGLFMQGTSLAAPLLIGAGMKILYDVMLYLAFRGIRAPEEAMAGGTGEGLAGGGRGA